MIYENESKTCKWCYTKFTPPGYKWEPKSITGNVNMNVSLPLVAFRKSTCFIRDLQGNDILTSSRGYHLSIIELQESSSPNPICFMAKASTSQAGLWHRLQSHLNFDTINLLSKKDIVNGLPKLKFVKDQLFSSCDLGKSKCSNFKSKTTPSSKRRLHLLHMDLCGPIRVESINGKKYILVIVDDYSRYTWTHFLRSKDETPKVFINFLRMIQRGLQAQREKAREIRNITSVCDNSTELEDCISLRYFRAVLMWPDNRECAIDDVCKCGGKTPGFRIYNKRTRMIVETIHVNFDELQEIASDHDSYGLASQCQSTVSKHNGLGLTPQCQSTLEQQRHETSRYTHVQYNLPSADTTNTQSLSELELLPVAAESPSLIVHNTSDPTSPTSQVHDVEHNSIQVDDAQFDAHEFINPFATPVTKIGETSLRHFDPSNMHQFYQIHPSECRRTRDHPLEQVRGNPSKPVQTRRQLATDL
ncbi:retrovirus-related pol polyprotein from transposon TNT 1-94 [Tanacetum coccineum]